MADLATTLLSEKTANILVNGYIRNECKKLDISMPDSLLELVFLWFCQKYQILKFSKTHRSEPGFYAFSKNSTMIRKKKGGHSYILADIQPLFEGVHCFRVEVKYNYIHSSINHNMSIHTDIC